MKTISWYDYLQSYLSSILLHLVASLNSNLDFIANGFSLYMPRSRYINDQVMSQVGLYINTHTYNS